MSNDLTMLEAVEKAANQLGLVAPSTLFSTNLQTIQLRSLIEQDGLDLYQSRDWTCLQGEHIINVETPITQNGSYAIGDTDITGLSDTSVIAANYYAVDSNGSPAAQRVTEILSATSVRCEMEFTAASVAEPCIFARDTYTIPTDFDHYIPNTWWDRTNHWMLMGPQSPQFDQWQRSGIVTTGPRLRWRQIGKRPTVFRLWPPPTSQSVPDALVFEYVNEGWIEHADGTFGKFITDDDDTSLMDDIALILGCKWRLWQIKGFSYGALQQEYIDYVNRLKARDGGMPDLSMVRSGGGYLITSANTQDGNFPGNS